MTLPEAWLRQERRKRRRRLFIVYGVIMVIVFIGIMADREARVKPPIDPVSDALFQFPVYGPLRPTPLPDRPATMGAWTSWPNYANIYGL